MVIFLAFGMLLTSSTFVLFGTFNLAGGLIGDYCSALKVVLSGGDADIPSVDSACPPASDSQALLDTVYGDINQAVTDANSVLAGPQLLQQHSCKTLDSNLARNSIGKKNAACKYSSSVAACCVRLHASLAYAVAVLNSVRTSAVLDNTAQGADREKAEMEQCGLLSHASLCRCKHGLKQHVHGALWPVRCVEWCWQDVL
jgi:hypothetical protein